MGDIYLGSDNAYNMNANLTKDVDEGKNFTREFIIQTNEKGSLESLEELYSLDGEFYITHKNDDGSLRNGYMLKFSIPNGMNSSSAAPVSDNSAAWNQFRDYLKARGPVNAVTNTEHGQNKVTIEEKAGTIQISRVSEATIVSGNMRFHALTTTRFDLPANAKSVNVQDEHLEEGTDENGKPRKRSGSTSHTWDIQNYRNGDEVSFGMDYSELDSNGNDVQKTGTLTATGAYAEIVETLSQTLAQSGLGITMADLGFINY